MMTPAKNSPTILVAVCLQWVAAWSAGCASLFLETGTCAWAELDGTPGIEAAAPREMLGGTAGGRCGTVGEYVVRRAEYTLKLWNGNQPVAVVFAAAEATRDRRRLTIAGDTVSTISQTSLKVVGPKLREFTHRIWDDTVSQQAPSAPSMVRLTIVEESGRTLGEESIAVQIRVGKYRYRDGF